MEMTHVTYFVIPAKSTATGAAILAWSVLLALIGQLAARWSTRCRLLFIAVSIGVSPAAVLVGSELYAEWFGSVREPMFLRGVGEPSQWRLSQQLLFERAGYAMIPVLVGVISMSLARWWRGKRSWTRREPGI